jgi:hypothetical protein
MKRQVIKSIAILIAVALLAPAFVALVYAQGVSLVTYPRYVTNAVPANDTSDQDNGPAYRQNNSNASNAPFAVILRVVGYSGTVGYFWLSDNQTGNTVQTYDRFDPNATKSLNPSCPGNTSGSCWLDESATLPPGLDGITITANSFYLMVIGRNTGSFSSGTINYTLHYTMSNGANGSISFSSSVITDCMDWYLNWDDTGDPSQEKGDPVSGADYVELYDNAGNSFTTAPVDGSGYFEMLLPNQTSGNWLAEARSESGSIVRAWYTTITNTSNCNELINSGTGGPTRVTLKGLEASAGQRPVLAVAAIVLLALGISFAFRSGRKSS